MTDHTDTIAFTDAAQREVDSLFARYPNKRAATLPVLHIAQREFGYLSDPVIEYCSAFLETPPIELKNTITFYTMFFTGEVGRHIIWVCHTLSCALGGAAAVVDHLKKRLQIEVGETTPDKMFTLFKAECLGSCDTAPVLQINDRYYEKLTIQQLDGILDDLIRAGRNGG